MTVMKKDYEVAIDEYMEAEKNYRLLEERFLSGDAVIELLQQTSGNEEKFKEGYQALVERLQTTIEDVNVKAVNAKNAFRAAVQLSPTNQRGPDGKPTTMTYGPLHVSSATKRWLDAESLLKNAAKHGVLDRLLALTSMDKNGKQVRLVEQIWKIDYENVYKWLVEQGLQTLINSAYDEKEETPRVTGVKMVAFLGDKVEKS